MKTIKLFFLIISIILFSVIYLWNDVNVMKSFIITSSFCEYRIDHFHTGIDIVGENENEEVMSFSDGELIFYNNERRSGLKYGNGNFVVIEDTENEVRYNYSHLKGGSINYQNTSYKKGQIIGVQGTSGYSTGNHLHFEIEDLKTNRLINPLKIFEINDNISPRIMDIYFITNDNEKISLVKEYNTRIKRGGKLYISCYDRINGSNFNIVPAKISLYIDGKEISKISSEYLERKDNAFITPEKRTLNDTYSSKVDFNYYMAEYKGLPGIVGFKIVVEDFNGNQTVFSRPLRILIPD